MDRWTPAEVEAHMQYMEDFAARLQETGEFVDSRALTPGGTWCARWAWQASVTDGRSPRPKRPGRGMDDDRRRVPRACRRVGGRVVRSARCGWVPVGEWLELRLVMSHNLTSSTDVRPRGRRRGGRCRTPGTDPGFLRRWSAVAPTSPPPRMRSRRHLVRAIEKWPSQPPADAKGWLVTTAGDASSTRRARNLHVGSASRASRCDRHWGPPPRPTTRCGSTSCALIRVCRRRRRWR